MKAIIFSSILYVTSLYSDVTIAAASNVSYVMDTLKKEFMLVHPEIDLHVTLGSSGKLSAQIQYGAPYDIFLSANMKYPQNLYRMQKTLNEPQVYTRGALVLVSQKYENISLHLLTLSKIKKIAIANPKTAPYGKAAIEVLKNIGQLNNLKHKFIYGESISQTLIYTLKAADIGIVAKSALYTPSLEYILQNKKFKDIDVALYTPIQQGMVLLKRAEKNKEAKIFYNFLLTQKAQNIFKKFGYGVIK